MNIIETIIVERKFNYIDANFVIIVRRKRLDDSYCSLIADAINFKMDAVCFIGGAFPFDAYYSGKDLRFVLLLCFISEVLWSLTEQLLLSARAGQ